MKNLFLSEISNLRFERSSGGPALASSLVPPCALLLVLTLLAAPAFAIDVAKNDALTPAEQQKLFKLPPGFEIELVVSEPTIGQPMNLNFDARGRLWLTHALEYPYPARGPGVEPRNP